MKTAERVRMIEVGPRDGLQNDSAPVSVKQRLPSLKHWSRPE